MQSSSTPPANPTKLLADLTPTNLLAEKTKFLADPTQNPVFTYRREFTEAELTSYGQPQEKFFEHSQKMLTSHPVLPEPEPVVTEQAIRDQIAELFTTLDLPPLQLRFDPNFIAEASFGGGELRFRLPIHMVQSTLTAKLNHEIQTHYLRVFNHHAHHWPSNQENRDFRLTEEGLANLHSHLATKTPVLEKSYLTYTATYLAQQTDFLTIFKTLRQFGVPASRAWALTAKAKRGTTDTSRPGGFTKDLVYLEGAVLLWQWLQQPENDPTWLYFGRFGLAELPAIVQLYREHDPTDWPAVRLPTFFQDMAQYRDRIDAIGKINQFPDLI